MQQEKERVALGSIAASAGLTIAKAAVGWSTGSLAILSEAAHSLIDFAATVMTYVAVRTSGKPADEEHHYGHEKVESLAALVETALLFVLSGVVVWEAGRRLLGEELAVEATVPAFLVIGVSIVVDFFRARLLYRVAGDTSSQALEADALHFGTDLWSSLAVLVGLFGVAYGWPWADTLAALAVAAFVCIAGWRLGKRTIDTLIDTAPAGAAERITRIAQRVPGMVAVERVRVRGGGATLFAEVHVAVSRTLPIDHVAALKEAIVRGIRDEMPEAEVSVVTDPRALDDETILERVNVIARNQALAIHHVTVHHIEDRLAISIDLEVDGNLTLGAAHAIADGLERAIAKEFGSEVEIETHIEPLQPSDIAGIDAPAARIAEVERELARVATESAGIRDVHNVRVRRARDGEIVNFHCRTDAARLVQNVHEQVDEIERALRARWPSIKRVIGHAEPLGVQ